MYMSQCDKNGVRQFFSRMCAREFYIWVICRPGFSALLRVSVFFRKIEKTFQEIARKNTETRRSAEKPGRQITHI
jgi:hypothetical protein